MNLRRMKVNGYKKCASFWTTLVKIVSSSNKADKLNV